MLERDDRGNRRAEVPLHFGLGVVVARVVAVEYQVDGATLDTQLPLELVERHAGVPQPDQVGRGDQHHLLSAEQHCAMGRRCGVHAQQLGSDIDDDPAVAVCGFAKQAFDDARADTRAHFALGRPAQHHRRAA